MKIKNSETADIPDDTSRKRAVDILLNHDLYIRKLTGKFSQKYHGLIDADDREDIVSDVKIEIMKGAFDNFRGKCSEESYLYTIVRYTFIDYLRKKISSKKEIHGGFTSDRAAAENMRAEQRNPGSSQETIIIRKEMEDIIKEEVSSMKPVKRAIYQMKRIDGMVQKEISGSLNRVQSTISEHWNNIMRQLEQALRKKYPDTDIDIKSILDDITYAVETR